MPLPELWQFLIHSFWMFGAFFQLDDIHVLDAVALLGFILPALYFLLDRSHEVLVMIHLIGNE